MIKGIWTFHEQFTCLCGYIDNMRLEGVDSGRGHCYPRQGADTGGRTMTVR